MNFSELIKTRQSVRSFNPEKEVEKEKIISCLEAARLTPSACNSQPWKFTVCSGKKAKEIASCVSDAIMNKWAKDVPVFIVISEENYNVTAKIGSNLKSQDFRTGDIGAACLEFCLQAAELELGTCIIGWFTQKEIQKAINTKKKIHLVIALGYPTEDYPVRNKNRKKLEDITEWLE
jgi:nitroreductase